MRGLCVQVLLDAAAHGVNEINELGLRNKYFNILKISFNLCRG